MNTTVGNIINWNIGPAEFCKAGAIWTLTVYGRGLCGIGWRLIGAYSATA